MYILNPMKVTAMNTKLLTAALVFCAASAQAQTVEQWNVDQYVLDIAGQAGFSYPLSNTTAISFTVPTTARCFKMEPNTNYWTCADSAANAYCGTSYTSASTTINAWEYNATARRIKAISGTVPTRLWVQPDVSNTTPKGHWYKCS